MVELSLAVVIVRHPMAESVIQEEGPACTKTERREHVHSVSGGLAGAMLGDEAGSLIQGLLQPVDKFGFCSPSTENQKAKETFKNRVLYYQELGMGWLQMIRKEYEAFCHTRRRGHKFEEKIIRSGLGCPCCCVSSKQPNKQ